MTINEKANQLVKLLNIEAWAKDDRKATGSLADLPVLDLTENLAESEQIAWDIDGFGARVAVYAYKGSFKIGLNEVNFKAFQIFVDELMNSSLLVNNLSRGYVEDVTFDWILSSHRCHPPIIPYDEYLTSAKASAIQSYKFMFPIYNIQIGHPFSLGFVEFNWIKQEQISTWNNQVKEARKDEIISDTYISDILNKYNLGPGIVYAQITIEAESEKAKELALYHAANSINCLKLFSDTIVHPKYISSFGIYTMIDFNKLSAYLIENISNDFSLSYVIQNKSGSINFKSEKISFLCRHIFPRLSEFLTSSKTTILGNLTLQAINRTGMALAKEDIYERILILCTTMESIFVPDEKEHDIARIARSNICWYLIDEMKERNIQMEVIKRIYEIRHKYIHKAQRNKFSFPDLVNFQKTVANAIFKLIEDIDLYKTKEELIQAIELQKSKNA